LEGVYVQHQLLGFPAPELRVDARALARARCTLSPSAGLIASRDRAGRRWSIALVEGVKLPVSKRDIHRLVLLLHHLAHDVAHALVADVLRVARLHALENAPTVGE